VLESLATDSPSNAAVHVLLGTARFGLGNVAEARDEMERALALDPESKTAHFNLAQILLAASPPDLRAARDHYRKALDLGSAPDEDLDLLLEDLDLGPDDQ